ncbi:MAG: Rne/Rng family ribonuclease [Mariprofundaceae bacterium]
MKKKLMLISAVHSEQSRVAIVDDGYLQELDIESSDRVEVKNNIYKGKITKVEASLQAAFVEYGSGRQGFLPLNEIHPDYWIKKPNNTETDPRKVSIQDVVESKQHILVQVVKEERGTKGAALTTFVSLAGRYLVLSPNTSRVGISRKLSDDERKSMRDVISQLDVPDNMGLIVRTAGKDQTLEELKRDFSYLSRLWDEIRIKSEAASVPSFIYLDGDLATRAIRDHFTDDIEEIWVDEREIYQRTKQFVHAVLPGKEKQVKLYRGKKSLFRNHGIEGQCEDIHHHEIDLPAGGSIVFDPTEALTAIDVNSGRATKARHIDDTALATNLEAAKEIARQIRIRDIGGLIVIDFIDMVSRKHAQRVEEVLRESCKGDKARIQITRISRFGLLEMSRQRLHLSVRESTTSVCPRCTGRGRIRTTETMALQILTRIEDHAEMGKKPILVAQVPTDTGEYLMNNKRSNIAAIESLYDLQITLQIRPDLEIPHFRIERQWMDENQQRVEVLEDTVKGKKPPRSVRKHKVTQPLVGIPDPDPELNKSVEQKETKKKGLISQILSAIFGDDKKEVEEKETPRQKPRRRSRGGRNRKPRSSTSDQPQGSTQEKTANSDENKKEDTISGEEQQRKRRRRRRRPAAKTAENREDTSSPNISTPVGDEKASS